MDLKARLSELARWQPCPTPVVSVYLDTEWTDEQQRERVRIFLKNALRDARERALAAPADLDWIERQGRAVIDREVLEAANGAALFACEAAGLREMVPVRMPFEPTFVVESTPFLRPLAGLPDDTPASLVVFVDGTTARLIPLNTTGPESEAVLEAQVEGRHSMGGWAALAQSRYQRHIEMHREQHFEATAAAVTSWSDRRGAPRRLPRLSIPGAFGGGGVTGGPGGAVGRGGPSRCPFGGGEPRTRELGEALVERVRAGEGPVTTIERPPGLARGGGLAARLRYLP